MGRGRSTEDQITGVLPKHEAGVKTADLCRKHGISDATFYNWNSKYGVMTVSEAARLRTRSLLGSAEFSYGTARMRSGSGTAQPRRYHTRERAGAAMRGPSPIPQS